MPKLLEGRLESVTSPAQERQRSERNLRCVDGATRGEQNVAAAGRAGFVRLGRDILQRAMEDRLVAAVERLAGRKVRTCLSGSSTSGESAVEVFVLEPDHGADDAGARG